MALVTGASRGIGSAIATALVEQGAQVVISSRKQADLDAEAERINASFPERAVAYAVNATVAGMTSADFNGDGVPDVALGNSALGSVSLLLSVCSGSR